MAHLAGIGVDADEPVLQKVMARNAIEERKHRAEVEQKVREEKEKAELPPSHDMTAAEVLDRYMNHGWDCLGDANAAYCLAVQRRCGDALVEPDNVMAEHYLEIAAQKGMTPADYLHQRRWGEQATPRGQQWPFGASPEIEPDTRTGRMPRTSFPHVSKQVREDAIAKEFGLAEGAAEQKESG